MAKPLAHHETLVTTPEILLQPQIAAVETILGNFVYGTWRDNTIGNEEIFFRASNDTGETFHPIINLSNNVVLSIQPQISAVDNYVYVTWRNNVDIFFAVSSDNGQTFSNSINISNGFGGNGSPQIAAVGDNVYVAWNKAAPNGYFLCSK